MKRKYLFLVILFSFGIGQAFGQEAQESGNQEAGTSFSLFKSKTYLKNPLDLRDPFKRKMNKKKVGGSTKNQHATGVYSNQADSIESKPIESIKIIGILIGKERRALAKIASGKDAATLSSEVYYIKEGMKLGPNSAEVKAILPGGIVLVEKIRNVYDQDEYLETVIPVSNE